MQKSDHPLELLRLALDPSPTRRDFSALLGLSAARYSAIVLGRRPTYRPELEKICSQYRQQLRLAGLILDWERRRGLASGRRQWVAA